MSWVKPISESTFSIPVDGGTATVPMVDACCDLRGLRWTDAHGNHPSHVEIGTEFMNAVVRGILRTGRRLRFEAHGKSMRPLLADGSVVEIAPLDEQTVTPTSLLLFDAGDHRLVLHRAIAVHDDQTISLRGDNASRVDRVPMTAILGVAVAVVTPDGLRRPIEELPWSSIAPTLNAGNAHARSGIRVLLVTPFAAIVRLFRTPLGALAGSLSWCLHRLAVAATRLRIPIDRIRALLLTTARKDAIRQELYADLSVQDFTALSENMDAGLTLLEEHQLRSDSRRPGTALVVGCGPGREALELRARGFEVTGIDSERAMLKRAQQEADKRSLHVTWCEGEATSFDLRGNRFDTVIVWSGLLCMIYPSSRRVALLRRCAAHLAPQGEIYVTFLCEYVAPGSSPSRPRASGLAQRINPDHEPGDLWLQNEAIHVYPSLEHVLAEGAAAGLIAKTVFKDQRAYDRRQHVKGYVTFSAANN